MKNLVLNLELLQKKEFKQYHFSFTHLAIIQLVNEGRHTSNTIKNVYIPSLAFVDLELAGWIKMWGKEDISNVELREKALKFFENSTKNINFDELFHAYPAKGGTRPLRSVEINTKNYHAVKKCYLSKIKSVEKHKAILTALSRQVQNYTIGNKMQFMQNFATYVNQETWDQWMLVPDMKEQQSDHGLKEL